MEELQLLTHLKKLPFSIWVDKNDIKFITNS